MSSVITIDQLKRAQKIIAKVIALYGDTYLPIFERITKELELAQRNQDLKTLALAIAQDESNSLPLKA